LKHRPIGIGVQGLADVFQQLDLPYDGDAARVLNKQIFETIYYAALSESVSLAKQFGAYSSFPGSPFSQGRTQIELWGRTHTDERYPWSVLRQELMKHGARNSLLTAPMPTASTAQIMGNTESFEPRTSNLYTRRVLAGEYIVINKYLQEKLTKLGLWSTKMERQLIEHRGSVQHIPGIPAHIKRVFRTVWEISQRSIIDMAADRAIYIDQSQSLNLHIEDPSPAVLTSVHFHTWSKGLKTGQYYLRTQPKTKAIQFTVATKRQKIMEEKESECVMCSA
jgi:ribonucleoside-diphosphate reductase alpha chain